MQSHIPCIRRQQHTPTLCVGCVDDNALLGEMSLECTLIDHVPISHVDISRPWECVCGCVGVWLNGSCVIRVSDTVCRKVVELEGPSGYCYMAGLRASLTAGVGDNDGVLSTCRYTLLFRARD